MTEFEIFLEQKKINSVSFRKNEPIVYLDWEKLFLTVHPESFFAQKHFLINGYRHKYPLLKL